MIWLSRTPAHVRRDQIDHYAFAVTLGGSWRGDARGRRLDVAGDTVFVLDMARPMTAEAREMNTVQLVVPRDLLDAVVPSRDLHGVTLRGAAAGLLHDHVGALMRRPPDLTEQDAPGVMRATLAMLAAAARPSSDNIAAAAPVVETVLLARVRRHIECYLHDPALAPDAIGQTLGVSRSRLYALFERFGGVSAYIQGRRLARIHAILAAGNDPRQLFAIAQSCGFTNPGHFSRAFRAAYGVSPRDLRRHGRSREPVPPPAAAQADDTMMTWLRSLAADF
jgi:AraC-like DNA-binding protein